MKYIFITLLLFFSFFGKSNTNLLEYSSFEKQRNKWIVEHLSLKHFFNNELDINFLACININFFSKSNTLTEKIICHKLYTTKQTIKDIMVFKDKNINNTLLIKTNKNNKTYIHTFIQQNFNINSDFKEYFALCNFTVVFEDNNTEPLNYQSVLKKDDKFICSLNFFESKINPTSIQTILEIEATDNSFLLF